MPLSFNLALHMLSLQEPHELLLNWDEMFHGFAWRTLQDEHRPQLRLRECNMLAAPYRYDPHHSDLISPALVVALPHLRAELAISLCVVCFTQAYESESDGVTRKCQLYWLTNNEKPTVLYLEGFLETRLMETAVMQQVYN